MTCFSVCRVMTVFVDLTQISPCKTSALSLLPVIFSLKVLALSLMDERMDGAAGQTQLRRPEIQAGFEATVFTFFMLHCMLKNHFVFPQFSVKQH